MSRRRAQAESSIKRAISTILTRKASDPRIRGLVSVSGIELSTNFKEATVFITVIPEQHTKLTLHGLNSGRGMFQSHLSKALEMKSVPKLTFRTDEGRQKEDDVFDDIQRGLSREGLTPGDVVHVGEKDEAEAEALENVEKTDGDGLAATEESLDQPEADTEQPSANSTESKTP